VLFEFINAGRFFGAVGDTFKIGCWVNCTLDLDQSWQEEREKSFNQKRRRFDLRAERKK